ncbi:MAG: hypothetical protein BGO01_07030 [Armatimonadetes bacterium 55-13]|nr:glycosyltransferase family 4 protein [Armatimonadota bacterium]OJU62253.1 MAG: hypothetical protein BGO01_07030 [Armatimonadetes bacterium 55-13]
MSLDGWQIVAITLDYPHHASGSGYGQLARLISYDRFITPPSGPIAKAYSKFVHKTAGNRFIKKFTRRKIATEVKYFLSKGFRPTLVHAFYGEHHSWLLRALRKRARERRVMTIHLPPSLWHVSFKPHQIQQFDAVILMSHSQLAPLRDELGYQGRVEVIEHGVDVDRFSFVERTPSTEKITCAMVGNFLRDYEALARLAQYCQEHAPEIRFDVVANREAGKPVSDLPNVTHHIGVSDEKLIQIYQEATFALFTLADCTANNAVLEAMSTGLPTFSNDVGGIRSYIVENQENIRDIDDHPATVAELRRLAGNLTAYQVQSQKARENALRFQWSAIAERTQELYREVIRG